MKMHKIVKYTYLLFLGVFTAVSDAYFQGGNTGFAGIVAKALVYLFLYLAFFTAAEKCLDRFENSVDSLPSWYRFFQYKRGNVLRLSVLFFAIYFFYLLVFYPGVTSGDTVYQITDLVTGTIPMVYPSTYSNETLSALMIDSNPVATTLIFTLFYKVGLVLGDPNRGLFLYCLFQCACLSILFATIVCFMDRLQVPKPVALLSTVFFASPVIASFAIFMGKDMLFSLCFVLYYHVFAWLVLKPKNRGGSGKQWALLILLSILISLMNKKGMYLALFSNLCLIFVISGKKKLLALPAAVIPYLFVSVLMQQLLFPVLIILPGGQQEVLGVAFQQTALSIIEHPERYSEEEKALFYSLLNLSPEELEEVYSPDITDPIKNRCQYDVNREDVRAYLQIWASHFRHEARIYTRATLSVSGGYFSPHKLFNVYQYTPYSEALGAFSQPERLALLRENLGALFYWLESLPIFSVFSQDSFYVFWFPAFALYHFCRKRQWRKIVLLTPFTANLLFLLFAPVCITRYTLCQLCTFPMLLSMVAQPVDVKPKDQPQISYVEGSHSLKI